jgi:phosphoserine phosphatase RsbU/P
MDVRAIDRGVSAFRERVGILRGTASETALEPNPLVEATLAELQLAEEELQVCIEEINSNRGSADGDTLRLLSKVFTSLPVPVLLLNTDGSIQRCNDSAAELLGMSQKHLTRRPLAGLVELAGRAAYRTALSKVVRAGGTQRVPVRLAEHRGDRDVLLLLRRITLRDETLHMVIAVVQEPAPEAAAVPVERPFRTLALRATGSIVQAATEANRTIANLRRALETRSVIGQATGILMAQRGLTADKAFDLLVRASQNRNVKLHRIARDLVADPAGDHGI